MANDADEARMNKGRAQRVRLDVLLVQLGLAQSREQAQRLILAGLVDVEGVDSPKPGQSVRPDIGVHLRAGEKYVGRGGLKLEAALREFPIDPAGWVTADIGASTGGFTDCLLQHGARKVYAVDVGASQLHERLRRDERVVVLDHTNARDLRPELFAESIDLFVVDVSFISLGKIIPSVSSVSASQSKIICLVKPQFEAGRAEVSKGRGVIADTAVHKSVLAEFLHMTTANSWSAARLMPSPIRGGSGNIEYLALLTPVRAAENSVPEGPTEPGIDIDEVVTSAFNHKPLSAQRPPE